MQQIIVSASCLLKFTLTLKKKYAMATTLIILWNLDRGNSTGEKKSHERKNHLLFTGKSKCVCCSQANP